MTISLLALLSSALTCSAQVAVPSRTASPLTANTLFLPDSLPQTAPGPFALQQMESLIPSVAIGFGRKARAEKERTEASSHRAHLMRIPDRSPFLKQYPGLSLKLNRERFNLGLAKPGIGQYADPAGLPHPEFARYATAEAHLRLADAYLNVGLYTAADVALAQISPQFRDLTQVLVARMKLHQGRGDWRSMEEVAREILSRYPDDPIWYVYLSIALRGGHSLEEGRDVLANAYQRYPTNAAIAFNLACYEAQLGRMAPARFYLRRAFEANPKLRRTAEADPDLLPIHAELNSL